MPEDNVLDQFSKDFKEEVKVDDFSPPVATPVEAPEDEGDVRKNRAHRRLEAENQRLREEAIALGTRVQVMSEAQKFAQETGKMDVDEALLTLYGDNDNGRKAAQITQSLLDKAVARAKEESRQEVEQMLAHQEQEVQRELETIDSEIESIEDRYNVDLSGASDHSKNLRNGFLTFVEKMSHKDRDGNIDQYPDFDSAWEEYQSRLNSVQGSRQKDLASRGMVRSGSSTTRAEDTAAQKYLRDNGII